MTRIFKIFRQGEYETFVAAGRTLGAPIDLADGYIHFSTAKQAGETAEKHFAGEDGLKVLAVQVEPLGDDLKWEVSRGGALFPHLYRELRAEDVDWAKDLPLVDGMHQMDEVLGD